MNKNIEIDNMSTRMTSALTPGTDKYKSYDISSSPTYTISVSGQLADMVTVRLDLNDLANPNANGSPNWKKSNTITISANGGTVTKSISPGSAFKFVSGRSDRARLKFTAASSNLSVVTVTYPG